MTIDLELIEKMAAQGDAEGIIKIAKWVADNEGKNELLANYLRDIIEKNNKIESSQHKNIFTGC